MLGIVNYFLNVLRKLKDFLVLMNKIFGQIKKKSETFMNFVEISQLELELTQVEKDHHNS